MKNIKNPNEQEPVESQKIITFQWTNTACYIIAVFFIFALLGMFIFISPIAHDLVAALLLAFVFDIPIRFITRRTALTYRWSAVVVYMLLYIVLALLLFVGWKLLVNNLQGIVSDLSQAAETLLAKLQGTAGGAAPAAQSMRAVTAEAFAKLLALMVKTLLGMLSSPIIAYGRFAIVIVNVGLSVFISNLLVFSAYGARGRLRNWVPEIIDREATILITYFDRIWGNYLAGMAFFVLLLGAGSIIEF